MSTKCGGVNSKIKFLVAAFCVVLGLLNLGCVEDYFIYFPSKYPEGSWDTSGVEFPLEDCYFTTEDGVKLHGWFAPQEGARSTVLWFHGNAGNISGRLEKLIIMRRFLNVNIFVFDYRGYGRSEGRPSEQGLYKDARAAYKYLLSRLELSKIYLYGQSLGAAVAAYIANEKLGDGLIMEAGFSSLLTVAADLYPILPARFITRERYDSLRRMRDIKMPVLIVHGAEDNIIPARHSQKLYEAANEPKELLILKGAGHNDIHYTGGKEYWIKLKGFVGGHP